MANSLNDSSNESFSIQAIYLNHSFRENSLNAALKEHRSLALICSSSFTLNQSYRFTPLANHHMFPLTREPYSTSACIVLVVFTTHFRRPLSSSRVQRKSANTPIQIGLRSTFLAGMRAAFPFIIPVPSDVFAFFALILNGLTLDGDCRLAGYPVGVLSGNIIR